MGPNACRSPPRRRRSCMSPSSPLPANDQAQQPGPPSLIVHRRTVSGPGLLQRLVRRASLFVDGELHSVTEDARRGRGVAPPQHFADDPQPGLRVADGDVDVTPPAIHPAAAAVHLTEPQALQLLLQLILVVAAAVHVLA